MRARVLAWIAFGVPVSVTLLVAIAVTFTADTIR